MCEIQYTLLAGPKVLQGRWFVQWLHLSEQYAHDTTVRKFDSVLSFFLSFARSNHLDLKKERGNLLFFTCFDNILQMLILQLAIDYDFGLFRAPKYVHENEASA